MKFFRSPSKNKKSKTFKFPSTRKEKREKSKECKERSAEKEETKETKVKDETDGKKKKEKKKTKQGSISSEVLSLGDAQPIFGVSLGLAVSRSPCHDLGTLEI